MGGIGSTKTERIFFTGTRLTPDLQFAGTSLFPHTANSAIGHDPPLRRGLPGAVSGVSRFGLAVRR